MSPSFYPGPCKCIFPFVFPILVFCICDFIFTIHNVTKHCKPFDYFSRVCRLSAEEIHKVECWQFKSKIEGSTAVLSIYSISWLKCIRINLYFFQFTFNIISEEKNKSIVFLISVI